MKVDYKKVYNVPNQPVTTLIGPTQPINEIVILLNPQKKILPPAIVHLADSLSSYSSPTFFDGPFTSVEAIYHNPKSGRVTISTQPYRSYEYHASVNSYLNHQQDNPSAPLSFDLILKGNIKGRESYLLSIRPPHVSDFPNAIGTVSAANIPTELDMRRYMAKIALKKADLNLDPRSIVIPSLQVEKLNNIINVVGLAKLTPQQTETAATRISQNAQTLIVPTNEARNLLMDNSSAWNYSTFGGIRDSLFYDGLITHQQYADITTNLQTRLASNPINYLPGTYDKFPQLHHK